MDFRKGRSREELEINLIPLIDVLLVIIIFLMLTTTYSRFSGLEINLPTSESPAAPEVPNEIDVAVTATGDVLVNRRPVGAREIAAIADALRRAAPEGTKPPVVVISADAKATHQSVIDVMQAAQRAGLSSVTFATQAGK
ncbi:ExbD/TolR family protein [Uliginosibacterium sp. H1]|uniref:ExbD/TolR family protein n=1 Tax=Uliginosibacterium sp. H1 TaxID=3114757 RepID=UPI002E18C52E|nr:biopolymer transporter ExbD [Uliginosibacterium sp. H1]